MDMKLLALAKAMGGGSGGSGGGGGVSSWNDLTDKPFYSEEVDAVFFEGTVEFQIDDGSGTAQITEVIPNFSAGKEYQIVWDNTTYNCTCYLAPQVNAPALGSASLAGLSEAGEPDVPFFMVVHDGLFLMFTSAENAEFPHTVKISGKSIYTKRLDAKYAPDTWVIINEDRCSKTFEEAYELLSTRNGLAIVDNSKGTIYPHYAMPSEVTVYNDEISMRVLSVDSFEEGSIKLTNYFYVLKPDNTVEYFYRSYAVAVEETTSSQ